MNPAISDDIDKALVSSIAQEMVLCRKSLLEFATLSHRSRIQRPNQATTLEANLAYSRFLCHLYEFYLGCISRSRKSTSPLDHVRADDAISLEARKQLNQARILIRKGLLPRLPDNTLYAIQTKDVPQNFGMHFRLLRNRMSHASIERYKPIKAPALKYVFESYHHIFVILYNTAQFSWGHSSEEQYHWGDMGEWIDYHSHSMRA